MAQQTPFCLPVVNDLPTSLPNVLPFDIIHQAVHMNTLQPACRNFLQQPMFEISATFIG